MTPGAKDELGEVLEKFKDPSESLRDRLAMAALTGLLAEGKLVAHEITRQEWLHWVATSAYEVADAMLAARK